MSRALIRAVFFLSFLAAVYYGLVSFQRHNLYFPVREVVITPANYKMPFEDVALRASDGTQIRGWFIPAAQSGGKTLLLCHGNGGNMSHRLDKIVKYRSLGLSVMTFDYRGYGQSQGSPTERGTYLDAAAVYDYLAQEKKIPPSQLVIYGESMGCAVALETALHHPASALILESPFTSLVDMAQRTFPKLPVRWIVVDKYDNLSKIPGLQMPLLLMHSREDDFVPFSMGQKLFAAAPEPKQFFQLHGNHNEGYKMTGSSYLETIRKFLEGMR